jgi:addiction module HigA family antidote
MICENCWYEKFNPNINILPWETIIDILKAERITQTELANKMWINPINLNRIIKWHRSITCNIAYKLEKELWISAEFFMNLQIAYNLKKLRW